MKYIKKFVLFSLLASLCLTDTKASIVPHWIASYCSQFAPEKTMKYIIGMSALTLGAGIAGYYAYTHYFSRNRQSNIPTKSYKTFQEWKNACDIYLKPYSGPHDIPNYKKILSYQEFSAVFDTYFSIFGKDTTLFNNKDNWVKQDVPYQLLNSLQKNAAPIFAPYIQKLILPAKSTIAFHGDIHGDVHSLNEFIEKLQGTYLNDFTITDPNFYMVFLGDYTDRGFYGVEVIYTILRLKCANPDRVILARGNHEDISINNDYGFSNELRQKFDSSSHTYLFEKIKKMYESLPLALYLGCGTENHKDFIVCCHGGIELGFDPHELLNHPKNCAFTKLGALDRWNQLQGILARKDLCALFKNVNTKIEKPDDIKQAIVKQINAHPHLNPFKPESIITAKQDVNKNPVHISIGFQWNDYQVKTNSECNPRNPIFVDLINGRGWVIGRTFNKAVLQLHSDNTYTLQGIFRAHQHSDHDMINCILNNKNDHKCNIGVGRLWLDKKPQEPQQLWHNIVCTFSVCPKTPYGNYGFTKDTYGLLTVEKQFHKWRLQVVN